jgi:HEAT repeat protein
MLWALIGLALAGTPEDVTTSANRDLPIEARQEAFARLVSAGKVTELVSLGKNLDRPVAERWVAIRALGPIQTLDARQALGEFMNSTDVWARIASLTAAGERGDASLSGKVVVHLNDPAILVRAAAAETLRQLHDPSTLPDLERALQDPSGWYRGTSLWIRRKYVEAMTAAGRDAAPYLARALDDKDSVTAQAALAGLENIAGFSYHEGRSPQEEKDAWKRWAGR